MAKNKAINKVVVMLLVIGKLDYRGVESLVFRDNQKPVGTQAQRAGVTVLYAIGF